MCHLELVARDVQGAVKDTQNFYVIARLHQVGDAIMAKEEYAYISVRGGVALANPRELLKNLRTVINALHGLDRGVRIVQSNIAVDVPELTLSFGSPDYLAHVRMRCAISAFEIVRFASESARPRCTMT